MTQYTPLGNQRMSSELYANATILNKIEKGQYISFVPVNTIINNLGNMLFYGIFSNIFRCMEEECGMPLKNQRF